MYTAGVPRLWHQTIEAHRRGVREAILETTAALVAERGLHAVTMSQIAEEAGIGRATLYKYFPDVEAILVAWHQERVSEHLAQLAAVREQAGGAGERLAAVLDAYVRDLLAEAARAGDVRADVPADELASYCLHALEAAGTLPPQAVGRLA